MMWNTYHWFRGLAWRARVIRKNEEHLEAPVSNIYGCELKVFLDYPSQLSGQCVHHVVSSLRRSHFRVALFHI